MKLLSDFFHWLWLVIKKWAWLLGLLPILIDYGSAYIPGFPDIQLSWQGTLIFASIGILISAFLVHREIAGRLNLYQFHEPQYELEVLEVDNRICGGEQIHIESSFRIISRTEWKGYLLQISLNNNKILHGLGRGELSKPEYQPLDWHTQNLLDYPYEIPQAGCDFFLTIHYPILGHLTSKSDEEWQKACMEIRLLVGYDTQPVGNVEKSISLQIPVDLSGLLGEAREIQQRKQDDATID